MRFRWLPTLFLLGLWLAMLAVAGAARDGAPLLRDKYRNGDFPLVRAGRTATILFAPEDFPVVKQAAHDLAADVARVTGHTPPVGNDAVNLAAPAVIIGTLDHSPIIDQLARDGKLEVSALRGQWESFLLVTVPHPFPNMPLALVIVGSDRRGTAYGVYELSQALGVSPWHWWADVTPARRAQLIVAAGSYQTGPPSVQYRGIFLNDEDWGLQPWAAQTYEPERGDIGPKTYARICELLLRLKANTLWPAMHKCTRPFNQIPENKQVADDYAIIMGSSHAEPMLRNNVGEWTADPHDFDYTKNAAGVREYWAERVQSNGRFENIYTLGMRGIHDSPIQGPRTAPERIRLLERIFNVQRDLLAAHVAPEVARVPQIFCPYKEVLADYRNGLQVPEDVTIVFPDDNFGYIRAFPTPAERTRRGGFGVYYHISYLGRPLSYLWLNTTPPSLIWEEMAKAYEHGATRFWMLNVGDIKPAEIGIEFFMQLAWDVGRWRRENLPAFLHTWARREFGTRPASEIAALMQDYYQLGFARKPEHLQWYLPGTAPRPSEFAHYDYGDEAQARLDAYAALLARANRLYAQMPAAQRDAFYELVVYPVRGAAYANERFGAMEKSAFYAAQGRASAHAWAVRAQNADAQIKAETAYYNEKLAGGKWRHIMAPEMKAGQWPSMRSTPPVVSPALAQMDLPQAARLGVALEGRREPLRAGETSAALPRLSAWADETRFLDIFNMGRAPARWTARPQQKWLRISRTKGDLSTDARLQVSVNPRLAPVGENITGHLVISGAGAEYIVNVALHNPPGPRPSAGFVESNGVAAFEAEHFTSKTNRAEAAWDVIPGLGRTGDAVALFPTTAPEQPLNDAPALAYQVYLNTGGPRTVTCYLVPTQPLAGKPGLRYAVGWDNQTPQLVTVGAGVEVGSAEWARNVLNATTTGATVLPAVAAGPHVLRIYGIDAGVVVDKIVVDGGGVRPSYLGARETRVDMTGQGKSGRCC